MRRWFTPALVCIALLSACSAPSRPASPPAPATLLVTTKTGLAGVTATGAVRYRVAGGLPTPDGSAVVATDGDRLVVRDARTGVTRQSVVVGNGLFVATIDAAGRWVALTSVAATPYLPGGRTRTRITVVHLPDSTVQHFDLAGNLAPDSFAPNGAGLFLVSYLPPQAPNRYQITSLNLSTGEVDGIFGREKEALEDMRGVAGMHQLAPDGTTLYTLYLRPLDQADGEQAEIHTLKLDQFWAHCVDLPDGFGGSDLRATALAVSPDGSRVYAVDRVQRLLVEVDTDALQVTRTVHLPLTATGAPTSLVAAADRLYLSDGASILVLRTDTLAVAGRWAAPGVVSSLSADGAGIAATTGSKVAVFTTTGNRQATTALPADATAISGVVA